MTNVIRIKVFNKTRILLTLKAFLRPRITIENTLLSLSPMEWKSTRHKGMPTTAYTTVNTFPAMVLGVE